METKIWIEFATEDGEVWSVLTEDRLKGTISELSDTGKYSVQKSVMPPAQVIMVSFLPSARIVDTVTNQVGYTNGYRLQLTILNCDDWYAISNQTFDKEKVIELGKLFMGLNKRQAERIWRAKKLGKMNSSRFT